MKHITKEVWAEMFCTRSNLVKDIETLKKARQYVIKPADILKISTMIFKLEAELREIDEISQQIKQQKLTYKLKVVKKRGRNDNGRPRGSTSEYGSKHCANG
jgi:hypothetical protein